MDRAQGAHERTPLLAGRTGASPSPSRRPNQHPAQNATHPQDPESLDTDALEAHKQNIPLSVLAPSLASIFSVLFLAAIDGTLVVTLLNPIASSFGRADLVPHLATSYLLSTCCCTGLYGRLSDYLGRKAALMLALVTFSIGNLLCAVSPSIYFLIAARFVAGIGGGGLLTCCSVILTDLLPLRSRGVAQGWTQIVFSLGNALGGPVGGLIADWSSWRAAFGVQLPLLALAVLLLAFKLHLPNVKAKPAAPSTNGESTSDAAEPAPPRHSQPTFWQRIVEFVSYLDIPGVLLMLLSLVALLASLERLSRSDLSNGGVPHALRQPDVWLTALASVVFALLFVVREAYAARPLLELRLLRSKTVAAASAYYFLSSAATLGVLLHFPIYFEAVKLLSPSQTGLRFIPMTIATSVGSLSAGYWVRAKGRYWRFLGASSVVVLVMGIMMSGWDVDTPDWQGFVALVPGGMGGAASFTLLLIACLAVVDRRDQALINGSIYLFRSLGTVLGAAMLGCLFQAALASELARRIKGAEREWVIDVIRHNASLIATLPPPERDAAVASYAAALRLVFRVALAAYVVNVGLVMLIDDVDVSASSSTSASASHPPSSAPPPASVASPAGARRGSGGDVGVDGGNGKVHDEAQAPALPGSAAPSTLRVALDTVRAAGAEHSGSARPAGTEAGGGR